MTIPGFVSFTSTYRRLSRVRVLGATRLGRLPRVPDGWLGLRLAGATGPMDWHHVGPDPAQGTGGWLSPAPAGAGSAKDAQSTTLPEYVVRSSKTTRVGRIITHGRSESGSRPDSEQTGIAFPLPRVVESGTL
ncbi:hypothetical protein TIFTF001_030854 [Ficus carica]|uniref:Uncharacterized protein n=1 Tax=Ficus carica TaxID=3494 RepID=A0AA88DU74_FICCA|nr:hypothetical protein TIFTF001_030854 [Ficus carica]